MDKITAVSAAILCGGKNSRMKGKNKSFCEINGAPLIENTIGLLKEIFEEIILVTNTPRDFKLYEKEVTITGDLIKDAGPLGGIHSGLFKTVKEGVFFVACDMPFLHNAFISRLVNDFKRKPCDCLAPRIGRQIEPLHAIYKKSLQGKIRVFLKNAGDYSVRGFLNTVDARYFDLENKAANQKMFENLNTPEDISHANKI